MPEQPPADVPKGTRFRRWLIPGAGLATLLLLVGAVATVRSIAERPPAARSAAETTPLAAPTATDTPTAAPTATDSPSAEPTVTRTVTPTANPTTTVRPSRQPAPTRSTSGATQRPSTTTTTHKPKPACTPAGVVDVVQVVTYGVAKVAARTDGKMGDQLCPGERIRVFWATYSATSDGGAKLYRSQVRYLDHSQPTWTMTLELPGNCGDSYYVVRGNATIPQTLKPGEVPFGSGKMNWLTGGGC
ncbi:MAG TPA: hypothetical protein VFX60_03850 [Micromonospora sp.]|nr:hypothetical protein [Micromonospora sp.]